MGAAASTAPRGTQREPRIAPVAGTPVAPVAGIAVSPAAAVAIRGQPPQRGATVPRSSLFGMFGSRPSRVHLESTIETLVADLSAAKARAMAAERDLQDAQAEALQQGVPRTECVVCMAATVSTVLVPCGHLCLCSTCATSIQQNTKALACPLCRVTVERMHRVFLPSEQPPPVLRPPKLPSPPDDDDIESSLGSSDPVSPASAADAGVQTSPAASPAPRRTAAVATSPARTPNAAAAAAAAARVIKSDQPMPRLVARVTARTDDDIILRPSQSIAILRPPAYSMYSMYSESTREQSEAHASEGRIPEVRGSPADRPGSYDFVLPGAFVPSNPSFASTWDGALRVRE